MIHRRAIAYSFIAEIATTSSMVGCLKMAAASWGTTGFGEWAVSRRVLSLLLPLVVCGLDIAIPRYAATAARNGTNAVDLMWGAMCFVTVTLLAGTGLLLLFQDPAASLVYGNSAHAQLIPALLLMAIAGGLYVPCYGFLRGSMRIMEANLVHVLMYGLIPPTAMLLAGDSPRDAMLALGVLSLVLSISCVYYVTRGSRLRWRSAVQSARTLVSYGVTRMYAALFLIALGSVPTIVVSHYGGLEQAGFVALGLTLVGLAGTAVSPIGVTMLPLAARLMAEGRGAEVQASVQRLQRLIIVASVLGTIVVYWCAPLVSQVLFGESIPAVLVTLRIAALGAGPFAYFTCMRNFIDARTERGINTRNVMVAFAVFLGVASLAILVSAGNAARIVVGAYVVALLVLAILTRKDLYGSARVAAT